jgi:hypothetical protein
LAEIGALGVQRLNYLTDDPWNPGFCSRWFLDALGQYDHVFSPRRAILADLAEHGCKSVSYLPFAYDSALCFPDPPSESKQQERLRSHIIFAGGADRDREQFIAAITRLNLRLGLYGDYWERYSSTRTAALGHATARLLRQATSVADVALCLVRRSNRDGHVMRSYEIPAIGACMLTEDTNEHRTLFGADGNTVVYFQTVDGMIEKLLWLLEHEHERARLAQAAHHLIVSGPNTYRDRLTTMLGFECGEA